MNVTIKRFQGIFALACLALAGCNRSATDLKEMESHRYNDTVVTLLSDKGDLTHGQNRFVIAFRSAASGKPVDAGRIQMTSNMSMPGMSPMSAGVELEPAGETGQYIAKGDFAMSGAWRFDIQWEGPAGRGNVSFSRNVR